MIRRLLNLIALLSCLICGEALQAQLGSLGHSVLEWPAGVTLYKPAQCFNGYTVITPYRSDQSFLIDMAGRVVHTWYSDPQDHSEAWFFKRLPNGHWFTLLQAPIIGDTEAANNSAVSEMDWNGKVIWK